MIISRNSVELLAPVGTWEVLEAAVGAGADAVYLGGKRFNMRMHRTDTNFDDEGLKKAVLYTHEHGVRLYVTVNNLLSETELAPMRDYLRFLDEIGADALIVQDLAVLKLAQEMRLSIELHASVMMNAHSEAGIRFLQDHGVARVVAGREMTLTELSLLKERTGVEMEYFMHGDMCMSHSGQCYHSGVVFGQSSNRGRCLKPCRWAFRLVDEANGQMIETPEYGPYKLALKDMCMYRHIPELLQAGVTSFKIEGRMRTAAFVERIVKTYRAAIDRYIADPTGYSVDESDWKDLYESRSRDFSTCFALGQPDASDIGTTGEREPRFFSQAVKEAGLNAPFAAQSETPAPLNTAKPMLSVRVADYAAFRTALENGAEIVYVGGDAFLPAKPWTLREIAAAVHDGNAAGAQVVVVTPRITAQRAAGELEQLFQSLESLSLRPAGVMVGNIGALRLANQHTTLPIHTDYALNLFNSVSASLLKEQRVVMGTVSVEASIAQIRAMLAANVLPLALIVHGAIEAMVLDHSLGALYLGERELDRTRETCRLALLDNAGEKHPIRVDQYGRNHLLFAKDLCLLEHLGEFTGIGSLRLEAQHYEPQCVAKLVRAYRDAIDGQGGSAKERIEELAADSPRAFGVGAFRYRVSR